MATYTINPERETLHGQFSRDFSPALTIDADDTVIYHTLDAGVRGVHALLPHGALVRI